MTAILSLLLFWLALWHVYCLYRMARLRTKAQRLAEAVERLQELLTNPPAAVKEALAKLGASPWQE